MTNEELQKERHKLDTVESVPSWVADVYLDEIERLQKAFEETDNVAKQLVEAYKLEADRYESESNKFSPLVQFTRGRQDAYENILRILAQALKGE